VTEQHWQRREKKGSIGSCFPKPSGEGNDSI
jgi:hypothetical protein